MHKLDSLVNMRARASDLKPKQSGAKPAGLAWRAPAGRVHWAGAEYAPQWNGYMEGAAREPARGNWSMERRT